jgi:hypothetical protein
MLHSLGNERHYQLSTCLPVGIESETGEHVLMNEDILSVVKLLIDIKDGKDSVDDVDTLINIKNFKFLNLVGYD